MLTLPVPCYALDFKSTFSIPRAGAGAHSSGGFPPKESTLPVTRDGTLHAVAFWFRARLDDGIGASGEGLWVGEGGVGEGHTAQILDTGPNNHSGDSNFRQAAVLLDRPMAVRKGQEVVVAVTCTLSQGAVVRVNGLRSGSSGEQAGPEVH
ncbi:unnamed protein product [Discosporangium mesarthrocarpum]